MTTRLPAEAYAAALASLPRMSVRCLRRILIRHPDPGEAWQLVSSGRMPEPIAGDDAGAAWKEAAHEGFPAQVWEECVRHRMRVAVLNSRGYPDVLVADHEAPAVLFYRGELSALDGPRVAIVGTRGCTRYGREVARELGHDLAAAGVRIVSGLALGIDGAAHEGVLTALSKGAGAAPPIGVVGSGLDRVYPTRHRSLWQAVGDQGFLVGEAPPGAAPEPWRFPARNRIIAALAQVVVVVESHIRGGSRHTVDAAFERGVEVMAVPGSVRSPASEGTNELLALGVPPARDATDVLTALGLGAATVSAVHTEADDNALSVEEAAVLEVLGWEEHSLERLVVASCLAPRVVSTALARLEIKGRVERRGGFWSRGG